MAKRHKRVLLLALVAALGITLGLTLMLSNRAGPELTAPAPGEALRHASQGLDDVTINAVFDPVQRTLEVEQTLNLINRTGVTQRLSVLRTYANAFSSEETSPAATDELYDACYPNGFSAGELHFTYLRLTLPGGEEQGGSYAYGDDAHTVLRVSLPGDWAPGETLQLHMGYTLTIPQAAYRFGESEGIFALGNVLVIPSPWMDGEYLTDAYESLGDPFVSECRNYTVRVTAPEAYTVLGCGVPTVETQSDGQQITRFDAPAVRDFALYLSREYHRRQTMTDGVLVQAYARDDRQAGTLLAYASRALACYNARFGAYPYPSLTVAEAAFPFGGMEYPTLLLVGASKLATGGETLEQVTAHEVAHQWWYAVVGNDQFRQAWQDEALAQYSLLDYWETRYGVSAQEDLQFSLVESAMRVTIPQGVTPGSPVDYFGDMSEYSIVVYDRGAAALCALNTAMNGGLDGFLATYYRTFAFGLPSREDFETLLNDYTGEDWSPLLSDYLDTYLNN